MPGNDIKAIDQGLWCLDSHFVTWGCKGSLRMTIIQTPKGLILYSPVALSPEHVAQIESLGEVRAIIAPNLFHHFYLRACMAHFPAARVFVPEGLAAKIGPIAGAEDMTAFGVTFGAGDEVTTCTISGHRLNETVLFHHPTGTLVTADLVYNYQAEHFAAEKLFFRLVGCYGQPRVAPYHRLAVTHKPDVQRALAVIRQWPIRRIIMSHGRILESDNAGEVFADAWRRIVGL